jgi:predicted TPR repeat methyltransferase
MPESQQPAEGMRLMIELIGNGKTILDVGCGSGKWGRLLHGRASRITGVEVWAPCIERNRKELTKYYNEVIVGDIRQCKFPAEAYDVAILGDVLEHLPFTDACELVGRLQVAAKEIYLTIPISLCVQDGEFYGNPHESHLHQWSDLEVQSLGFVELHRGLNENGLVMIGTYVWRNGSGGLSV